MRKYRFVQLTLSIILIVGTFAIALAGVHGWGWVLVVALLMVPSPKKFMNQPLKITLMKTYLIVYREKDNPVKFYTFVLQGYVIADILQECGVLEKSISIVVVQVTLIS